MTLKMRMNTTKKMLLTIDDIRLANAQMSGKIKKPVLSDEDRILLERIKRVVGSFRYSTEVVKKYIENQNAE